MGDSVTWEGGNGDAPGRTAGGGGEVTGPATRPHVGPASLCSAGTNGAAGNGPTGRATGGADWCVPEVQTGVYPSTQPVSPARAAPGAALWAQQDLLPSLMDVSHTHPVPRRGFVTGAVWGQCRLPLAVPPFPSHAPRGPGARCRGSSLLNLYFLGFAATSWNDPFCHNPGSKAEVCGCETGTHSTRGASSPVGTSQRRVSLPLPC